MSVNMILWAIMLVGLFILVRNTIVYRIRIHFLFNEPRGFYDLLPSYDAMLFRHLSMWTTAQWRRRVAPAPTTSRAPARAHSGGEA